jgi:hypothetical protein
MNGYEPLKPQPTTPLKSWANQVHEAALNRRRAVQNPGALTTHTTRGTIVRPKPTEGGTSQGGGDKPVWL